MTTISQSVCSFPGCEHKSRYSKGLCNAHDKRARAGKPMDTPIQERGANPICSFPDCLRKTVAQGFCPKHYTPPESPCTYPRCDRPLRAQGLCNVHYKRSRNGKPMDAPIQLGTTHYITVHKKLRRDRGLPEDHACVRCSGPAKEWAFDNKEPKEVDPRTGFSFSTDMDRYSPMCVRCHRQMDLGRKRD